MKKANHSGILFPLVLIFFVAASLSIPGKAFSQQAVSLSPEIVLVGIDHPYFQQDTRRLCIMADTLIKKSPNYTSRATFSSGKELLEVLKQVTKQHKAIRRLAIVGHSGSAGYFVRKNAGFHKDGYKPKTENLDPQALSIKELKNAVQNSEIQFAPGTIIWLVGCNVGYGRDSFAQKLAEALQCVVVAPNQKVDLFGVQNFGEDIKGEENKTFFAFIPNKDCTITINLCTSYIEIDKTLQFLEERLKTIK